MPVGAIGGVQYAGRRLLYGIVPHVDHAGTWAPETHTRFWRALSILFFKKKSMILPSQDSTVSLLGTTKHTMETTMYMGNIRVTTTNKVHCTP